MTHLSYPSRTERVLLRLRPDELERAARLARAQEIKVPELIRRILAQAWRASTAADTGEGVWTEQTCWRVRWDGRRKNALGGDS